MLKSFKIVILLFAFMALSGSLNARSIHVFQSENLHCNDTVAVYSPHDIESARGLPTLFLLHGWSGCWRNWGDHMDLQELSDRTGFRIICPDGLYDSWYINNYDHSKPQWRDFFWRELWPMAAKTYGLQPDRTFITGLSMGGHGAMNIFLDHPELFRGAGSMSGVLDLVYSGGSSTTIPPMLGATDIHDAACTSQSAVNRLEKIASDRSKIIVVTCGNEDKFSIPAELFCDKCKELHLRYIKMLSPGKHRWSYWTWVLPYHIDWFTQVMNGESIGEGE